MPIPRFLPWLALGFAAFLPLCAPSPERLGGKALSPKVLGFDAGPEADPGDPWEPKGWTLVGPETGCSAVRLGGDAKTGVALKEGAALEIVGEVPAPEREDVAEGYVVLVGVDLYGAATDAKGGDAQLFVSLAEAGAPEPLASATFTTRAPRPKQEGAPGERHWLFVSAKATDALKGKKFRLRLGSTDARGVVVDRVEVVREPLAPSWKHLGRSNGGLGPDRLGAGALGFDALTEHRQSPLPVVEVREGSPAAKAGLKPGDIVVAVDGVPFPDCDLDPGFEWFERSHEAVLGRAVERAVAKNAKAGERLRVRLGILREGKPKELALALVDRAPLDDDFPFGKGGDHALAKDLLANVLKSQSPDGSFGGNFVRTGLGVLALLGTKDKAHVPAAAKALKWLLDRKRGPEDQGLAYWSIGYAGMALGEYALATGDLSVLRWAKKAQRLVLAGEHTSAFGMTCLGHGPDGLPYENKALVAPMMHVLAFEALVSKLQVTPVLWPKFAAFVEAAWSDPAKGGHGALGYNASYRDQDEFWSRTGLCLAAARLRGDREDMQKAMIAVMRKRHPWMLNSHAYGEPGAALGLMALAGADRAVFAEIMRAWRWKFEGAWEPGYGLHYTTPHMGSPYMGEDDLVNVAYLAVFSACRNGLVLTGGDGAPWAKGVVPPLFDTPDEYEASGAKAKAGWKVIAASGGATPELALERAARAIDGDPVLGWRTDVGKDAQKFPHHLELDLGAARPLTAIRCRFAAEDLAPSRCRILGSDDGKDYTPVGELRDLGPWKHEVEIPLGTVLRRRFLRLEFHDPRAKEGVGLALRELDLVAP